MAIRNPIIFLCSLFITYSCSSSMEKNYTGQEFEYGDDIEQIIAKMSIEEKVGQMTQINLDVISQGEVFNLVEPHQLDLEKLDEAINKYYVGSILNVGGHTYTREHWQEIITTIQTKATTQGNKIPVIYGIDAIHGVNYTVGATLFPQQIGQAATWNPELVKRGAEITAYECRASGIPWNFSPVLDLGRHPLWSRFFETYGEDVYLAKQMTEAAIIGYQGNDASGKEKVAGCMKHFLGYSMPLSGKDRTPAWIPERQLREYFLPTFEKAIESGALTVMINSGELNGIPVHADYNILTKLLRDELGFKGLAITDWEDIIKLYRDHKVAVDMRDAVKMAVMAGVDMSMTPNDYSFNEALIDLVKKGEVPESRLDEACRRILWVKKQIGLLENPLPDFDYYTKFASQEHKDAALNTALESITLLKNDKNILPFKKDANIFVCGPAANSLNILNGAWTHTWQGLEEKYNTKGANTILQAIQNYSTGKVDYALGSALDNEADMANAIANAKKADYILVCIGEMPSTEKPGDIEDLNLPASQQKLIKELSALGKPIVLVMVLNRPLIVREMEPLSAAIVQCYLPGDFGGDALANILFGNVNPSGKLPFTYPRHTGSLVSYDHKHTDKLDKDSKLHAFNPQWEFGFGLSYASFTYSNLKLNKNSFTASEIIEISVDVTNTSNLEGKEVVQIFISDEVASITPCVKRLRAFQKLTIKPNSTETVIFKIPVQELAFVGKDNIWITEPGNFTLFAGELKSQFLIK
jgi:beta-glucosidase